VNPKLGKIPGTPKKVIRTGIIKINLQLWLRKFFLNPPGSFKPPTGKPDLVTWNKFPKWNKSKPNKEECLLKRRIVKPYLYPEWVLNPN